MRPSAMGGSVRWRVLILPLDLKDNLRRHIPASSLVSGKWGGGAARKAGAKISDTT